jgi:hypothetical protein
VERLTGIAPTPNVIAERPTPSNAELRAESRRPIRVNDPWRIFMTPANADIEMNGYDWSSINAHCKAGASGAASYVRRIR